MLKQQDLRFRQGEWVIPCGECGISNVLRRIQGDGGKLLVEWQVFDKHGNKFRPLKA